jgi:hypothetical protein
VHYLYTRHLPSGETLHEIINAPNKRAALRAARELARAQAADGRGGTVQVLDGAGRFLVSRQNLVVYGHARGPRPSGRA